MDSLKKVYDNKFKQVCKTITKKYKELIKEATDKDPNNEIHAIDYYYKKDFRNERNAIENSLHYYIRRNLFDLIVEKIRLGKTFEKALDIAKNEFTESLKDDITFPQYNEFLLKPDGEIYDIKAKYDAYMYMMMNFEPVLSSEPKAPSGKELIESKQEIVNTTKELHYENFVNELILRFTLDKAMQNELINILKTGHYKKNKIPWTKSRNIIETVFFVQKKYDVLRVILANFEFEEPPKERTLKSEISRLSTKPFNTVSKEVNRIINKHLKEINK